ncbi:MAG: nicotinate (nicotinamide) nucleotide adenylyltransferase [Deltaproteobacteria bacterium]|nr:nicotinate (nicotinamide) nucleotide adenylyltransferase [Deltaproteobacteria bacterium]
MKVGVLGGTFNPIHLGHLGIAELILQIFKLEKVIFVPAKLPPFKSESLNYSAGDRYKMVELSIEKYPKFEISDIEYRSDKTSYTVTTLQELLKEKNLTPSDLGFIMGADSWLNVEKWWNYSELFKLSNFLIVTRGHDPQTEEKIKLIAEKMGFCYNERKEGFFFNEEKEHENEPRHSSAAPSKGRLPRPAAVKSPEIQENISETARDLPTSNKERGNSPYMIENFKNSLGLELNIIRISPIDISSTQIRSKIEKNQSVDELVSPEILNLIQEGYTSA